MLPLVSPPCHLAVSVMEKCGVENAGSYGKDKRASGRVHLEAMAKTRKPSELSSSGSELEQWDK